MWTKAELNEISERATLESKVAGISDEWRDACLNLASSANDLYSLTGDIEQGIKVAIKDQKVELETASRPLIKWLNDNHHPMTKIVVDGTSVEVLEGLVSFTTKDYLKD